MEAAKRNHEPDRMKIPSPLRGMEWVQRKDSDEFFDGQLLLAAVPVCDRPNSPGGGWHYEFEIVRVYCDEHYFSVEVNGEPWGWEMSDVDFYVIVK